MRHRGGQCFLSRGWQWEHHGTGDAGGSSLQAQYRYDAYGNTLSKSGTLADANVYRFSSKEVNATMLALGAPELYYYGYRFYDPTLQRWVNRDPLATGTTAQEPYSIGITSRMQTIKRKVSTPLERWGWFGPNLYQYSGNDPVNNLDALGLWTLQVGFTISGDWGWGNFFGSVGFTIDTQGHFDGFYTGGGGAAVAAGGSAGVTVQVSNAKCNNDLSGPFGYGSLGGGLGPYGSLDGFWGNSAGGPVFGGGGTFGVGLGGGGSVGVSGTGIHPL